MSVIAAPLPAPQDEGKSLDYVAVIKVPGNTKMIVRQGQGRFSHRLGLQRTQRHRLSAPFIASSAAPDRRTMRNAVRVAVRGCGASEVSGQGQARGESHATFAAVAAAALRLHSLKLPTTVRF